MTEDQIELLAIELLKGQGWDYIHGSDIANKENTLSQLRDELLPKLMSGKVKVKGGRFI